MLRFSFFMKSRLFTVLFTTMVLCGWQICTLTSSLAALSVSDQVSELLRQQIETWKTPSLEAIQAPPDDAQNVISPNSDLPSLSQAPDATNTAQPVQGAPTSEAARSGKNPQPKTKLTVGNETLRATAMLARFYEEREYYPAWSSEVGPQPQADALISTIQAEAAREGLQAGAYRLTKLSKLLQEVRSQETSQQALDPRTLTDLDLLLTDTFLTYGAHLSVGKSNLDVMDAQWFEKRQKTDLPQALQKALSAGQLEETLKALSPQHAGYVQLRGALARYREIAAHGGWPLLPPGFDLRPGDHDARIPTLRTRLRITGDLKGQAKSEIDSSEKHSKNYKAPKKKTSEGDEYDTILVQAVKAFQRRHGLGPDGIIGGGTFAALNVSVETRMQQLIMNMERWRALPQNLGARHIDVNIPNFTLDVVENERSILRMKVVVGKMIEKRNTPAFTAQMTHVVLNPSWYVPKSIAEEELFPLSRKNPHYFSEHKFSIRRVEVGEKHLPDPNASDGSMISAKVYQYFLKQAPGPKNALGRVKFMFPNPYGIYLHDTPSRDLFNRTVRTYSHGCIRVEKPIDLAEYLLRGNTKWTRESILSTIDQQKEKTVWLPEAIPVYVQYWTAWVDADGIVQFRNDIYGYDNAPGAQLPITTPRNPRPESTPATQPALREAQPTLSESNAQLVSPTEVQQTKQP